jgi:M6 family metalloprotease-like protein
MLAPGVFALLLLLGAAAHASTLDPRHRVWREAAEVRASFLTAMEELRTERLARAAKRADAGKGLGADGGRLLVLPVYYAGQAPPSGLTQAELERAFFGGDEGSVKSCYAQMSGGRFVIDGRVAPWLELPEDLSLYRNVVDGSAVSPFLAGPRLLVRDALRAASEYFDLTRFDGDGPDGMQGSGDDDGFIDLLVVLHPDAGFESGLQPSGPSILAHQSFLNLRDEFFAAEGAMGRDYVLASSRGPLGVWIHEFGHLLGLEDLYDLDALGSPGRSPGGLGIWSLMAGGTWGGGGDRPSSLDPFSRRLLGWDEALEELNVASVSFTTPALERGASLAIEGLGDWQGEHYLVELRAPNAGGILDGALPAGGALLYRVDPQVAIRSGSDHAAVSLLQADGRDDLGELINDGDAGDVFGLATPQIVDRSSLPSSESIRPSPSRIPPHLAFLGQPDGSVDLSWQLDDAASLRLAASYFQDAGGRRGHLFPSEEATWNLRFQPSGTPASAQLELLALPDSLLLHGPNPVSLAPFAGQWTTAEPWSLESRHPRVFFDAGEIELGLTVDGGARRVIRLGIPISRTGGLDGESFYLWRPRALAAAFDSTTFVPLPVAQIPFAAFSAFELQTVGAPGYDDGVEAELLSPWFARDEESVFRMWSQHATERARGNEVWDGGVIEVQLPDRPWQTLRPQGDSVVWIRAASEAATRGRWGFGGRRALWSAYSSVLPAVDLPMRVRVRFASDGSFSSGEWSVADGGTTLPGPRATIDIFQVAGRRVRAEVDLSGDVSRLFNGVARFHWRRPHEDAWNALAETRLLNGFERNFEMELLLPDDVEILNMGLFFESFGSAPVLLGRAGYGVTPATSRLSLLGNPAVGEARFSLEGEISQAHLDLFDLRGRLLRSLKHDSDAASLRWDGHDGAGQRVAAGSYLAVVREQPELRQKFVWIPR